MSWHGSPGRDPETRLTRRDPTLFDSSGGNFVSPAAGFDLLAPTYDQRLAGNPVLILESAAVLAALPDVRGMAIADMGCGTGRYALQMSRMGAEIVIGVDISGEMLAVAAKKAERGGLSGYVSWRQGDLLERLPISDASVDLVVCALTLSFLPDTLGALRELSRILSPTGSLIISDYHPHGLAQARAEAAQRDGNKEKAPYLRFTSDRGGDCRIARHVHTISNLFDAGREAGLTLSQLTELVADPRLCATYPSLRTQNGVPLAVIARFDK